MLNVECSLTSFLSFECRFAKNGSIIDSIFLKILLVEIIPDTCKFQLNRFTDCAELKINEINETGIHS
jgi:hypothetical protein